MFAEAVNISKDKWVYMSKCMEGHNMMDLVHMGKVVEGDTWEEGKQNITEGTKVVSKMFHKICFYPRIQKQAKKMNRVKKIHKRKKVEKDTQAVEDDSEIEETALKHTGEMEDADSQKEARTDSGKR